MKSARKAEERQEGCQQDGAHGPPQRLQVEEAGQPGVVVAADGEAP
jgi:hypothetical protein